MGQFSQSQPRWVEQHTGAYATPQFVGRETIRKKIRLILNASSQKPRVIFLLGHGGIGKTRLGKETLEIAKEIRDQGQPLLVAEANVDMYHVTNHTPSGLAQALYEVLTPPSNPFLNYEREHRVLGRMWLAGEISNVAEQIEKEIEAFQDDFIAVSKQRRIVIALDTAEKLVYGAKDSIHIAEAWEWLLKALTEWQDVVIVLAGRAEAAPLAEEIRTLLGENLIEIPVLPFQLEESLEYFKAVERAAIRGSDLAAAERVRTLSPETCEMIHLYSGGNPILLALLVDFMITAGPGQLPSVLRTSVDEAHQKAPEELLTIQNTLEKEIIGRLRVTPRLGDTLIALGRVPKGADAELLSMILGCSPDEAQRRLLEVQRYSFVKTRPSDERVFLHDEMYAILYRQVYNDPGDVIAAETTDNAVLTYYKEQNERIREELNKLYSAVETQGKERLDLNQLAEVHAQGRVLLTEIVYYRLRQNAQQGYMFCHRYLRDATLSGDWMLYIQIQTEMQSFLLEKDPTREKNIIDNLEVDLLLWEMVLLPVMRAWIKGDYHKLIEFSQKLRREHPVLSPPNSALLNVWEAHARYFVSGNDDDFNQALGLLDNTIAEIVSYLKDEQRLSEARLWQARAALAFAYRVRGYFKRVRGLMQNAIEDYQKAAVLFRQIDIRIDLATTINDMGFAMAELGQWADARSLVRDALGIRRYLGRRSPVAGSLNTLAMIDIREGSFKSAMDNADRALSLSRAIRDQRTMALALVALAEAQRRYGWTEFVTDIEERVNLLRSARDHADEAFDVFIRLGERARMAEALIERGCACRDWVAVRLSNPSSRDNVNRLFEEAKQFLRDAATEAGETALYRKIDALVDLAWLGHVANSSDLIDEADQQVRKSISADYLINPQTGEPRVPRVQAQVLIWPYLGKLEVLHGLRIYRQYEKAESPDDQKAFLLESTRRYFWGLQYSSLYGQDYQGIQEAKDQIYDLIKTLHAPKLSDMAKTITEIEKENHIENSAMKQFLRSRALWYGE